jgi:hypothetical protein
MAAFDPDAYLAKKTAPAMAFDPDVYLAATPSPSSGIPTGPRTTGTAADQIPGYGGPVPAADNARMLTTGQKVYQNIVRPVIAPTVEALGAAGGAALGSFLGPAGTVGGAGLGYGMAKEALKLGDIYVGGQTPAQAQTQPVQNILEGATMEAGGKVAGQALGKIGGYIADLRQIPQQKAAAIARKAMGKDLPEVLNALRTASPGASVAELTAKIQNPTWQALVKDALEKDPQFLRKAQLLSETESRNVLSQLVGGATAAEARGTAEAAKNALNQTTTPLREAALNRANLGKDVARYETQAGQLAEGAAGKVADVRQLTQLGKQAETASATVAARTPGGERIGLPLIPGRYTYPGELAVKAEEWASKAADASLDLGQGARFAQGAADALRSVGIKPLEGAKIAQSIAGVANKPEFAGNDLIAGAAKNVADDIAKWTSSGGVIDAVALDAIRKNSVNAAIQQLRPGVDATTQRNLAAGVLSKVKPLIDDALEAAGGTGYKQYLADYAKGSRQIAERKLTGEAARLWKTDKDAFVRLVQNESPDVVEKFLGPGNYNIATELADNTMSVLQKQAQKRLTELSVKEQVSEGGAALSQLLKQQTSILRVPSFLNFWAAAGNKTLSELEKAVGAKTLQTLTEAMKTPQGAANLLQTLPATERNRVLNLLSNPQQWKPGAAAVAGNALTTGNENQNALIGR